MLAIKDNFFIFDKVDRSYKKDTILAIAYAVYNLNDDRKKLEESLITLFNIFRANGSGSYTGESKEFLSHYTPALDFGVIQSSSLESGFILSDLAKKMVVGDISSKEYISIVMLNYIQIMKEKDNKIVHLLLEILKIMKELQKLELNLNEVTGKEYFDKQEYTRIAFKLLGSTYFFTLNKDILNFNTEYDIDKIMSICNTAIKRAKEIGIDVLHTNQEEYSKFLTFDNLNIKVENSLLNFSSENKDIKLPYQKIVYGAPGTGKSYSLNQQSEKYFGNNIKRVTFYDGYTYGQFVGMYKPTVDEKNGIGYSYVPGPFMQQLVQSLKNSEDNFCLVVEEINRAKADKVFGNIFQLLDRDNSGKSRYPVSVSEEQLEFLKTKLEDRKDIFEEIKEKGLYIPDNLYIWATMNSADEGVQPLDTAFKRRWKFEYISLNKNEKEFEKQRENIKLIVGQNKTYNLEWNTFRKIVNNKLQEYNITEDRLIAPFFISPYDFTIPVSESIYALDKNIFVEKVLMYIFDDLLRHYPKIRNEIFKDDVKTFSKIYEALSDGEYELDNYYKKLNAILSESLFPELFKEEKNASEK